MVELWTLSARELAGGIARKDFSCTEVVEAHLRRIGAVNARLNAMVKIFTEEARRDAAEADRKVAAGQALDPGRYDKPSTRRLRCDKLLGHRQGDVAILTVDATRGITMSRPRRSSTWSKPSRTWRIPGLSLLSAGSAPAR